MTTQAAQNSSARPYIDPAARALEPNPFEQSFSSKPSASRSSTDGTSDSAQSHRRSTDPDASTAATSVDSSDVGKARRSNSDGASHPATPALSASASASAAGGSGSLSTLSHAAATTPKTYLPPVSSFASPGSSLHPWAHSFNSSLRTGPLSPAMLARPQSGGGVGHAFDHSQFRSGFTPDLSHFKTGLTPTTGSGYPPPSPNTAALMAMINGSTPLGSAATTPNTVAAFTSSTAINASNAPGSTLSSQPQHYSGKQADAFDLAFARAVHGQQGAGSKTVVKEEAADEQEHGEAQHHRSTGDADGKAVGNRSGDLASARMHDTNDRKQQTNANDVSGLALFSQAKDEILRREQQAHAQNALQQHQQQQQQQPPHGQHQHSQYRDPMSLYESTSRGEKRGSSQVQGAKTGPSNKGSKSQKTGRSASPAQQRRKSSGPSKPRQSAGRSQSNDSEDEIEDEAAALAKQGGAGLEDDDDKRKEFLERNRQAALKCRQRKKAWLAQLQSRCEFLEADNENLQATVGAMRNEIEYLKAQLLAATGQGPIIPAGMKVGPVGPAYANGGHGSPAGPHPQPMPVHQHMYAHSPPNNSRSLPSKGLPAGGPQQRYEGSPHMPQAQQHHPQQGMSSGMPSNYLVSGGGNVNGLQVTSSHVHARPLSHSKVGGGHLIEPQGNHGNGDRIERGTARA